VNSIAWWHDYREYFEMLGDKIKKAGMRVSMHPGQYTVLNSKNPEVVDKAILELQYHARVLDTLGVDQSHKLILHIGGVYGNKPEAANDFIRAYRNLPEEVKRRLIIENDDRSFTIEDVLQISEVCGAPVVFDNLHHHINPPREQCTDYEWILRCSHTWKSVDGKQKMHYSQQKEQALPGSHSDTIFIDPFLEYYQQIKDLAPDIMLEVKDKNLSAVKCNHFLQPEATGKQLEAEWARYKYYILSKDARAYQRIRELLKDKEAPVAKEFYHIVENALLSTENPGAQVNAAQHVWGYFSKDCTASQKKRFETLMENYTQGKTSINMVKNHLLKCAVAFKQDYLIHSLYFYL
jgi:UV DNA damage endonuclease